MSLRLTIAEKEAILTALAMALAGEGFGGYEDRPDEEQQVLNAMLSAHRKLTADLGEATPMRTVQIELSISEAEAVLSAIGFHLGGDEIFDEDREDQNELVKRQLRGIQAMLSAAVTAEQ
jgi:hypothetical protein